MKRAREVVAIIAAELFLVVPFWTADADGECKMKSGSKGRRAHPGVNGGAHRFITLVLIAIVPLLGACEMFGPRALSLEEAKKITTELKGEPFVPPPRTINDITAILDQEKPNLRRLARARAAADREPPVTNDAEVLANFYLKRAMAAGYVGRPEQRIADLTQAAHWAKKSNSSKLSSILFKLGFALFGSGEAEVWGDGGHYAPSLDYFEQAIEATTNKGDRLWMNSVLAAIKAFRGDLEGAEKNLAIAQRLKLEIYSQWRVIEEDWVIWWELQTDNARAQILEAQGRHKEAEAIYRKGIARLASSDRYRKQVFYNQVCRLARSLKNQGRLIEAEVEMRKSLLGKLKLFGRYSTRTFRPLGGLADILIAQGRYAEAETLARASIEIFQRVGASSSSYSFVGARVLLGKALLSQGRWEEALATFESIREALAADPKAYGLGVVWWAIALMKAGRAEEALGILRVERDRYKRLLGEKHPKTAMVRGLIAMALFEGGDRRQALTEFGEAIPVLVSRPDQSSDESTMMDVGSRCLKSILDYYIGALAGVRGTELERWAGIDAMTTAFRIAEAARGRGVERALAASSARTAAKDPRLADLVRREQDAQNQVSALYGMLANALSVPTDQQNPEAIRSLRYKIDKLDAARSALRLQIEREFPDYAQLLNPKLASVEEVQRALRPGEALVATYVGEKRTYIWAIPHEGKAAFAAVPLGRERIAAAVGELRKALNPNAQTLGDIPAFDLALAHKLFNALLAPVEPGWRGARSLIVIPHGALGQLPFSLLPTERVDLGPEKAPLFSNYRPVRWLVRTAAVTNMPSVASLVTLRGLPAGDPKRRPFIGFGDPYFSEQQAQEAAKPAVPSQGEAVASRGLSLLQTRGLRLRLRNSPGLEGVDSADLSRLPRLPDTAEEVRSIALAMEADLTKDVFLGARANEGLVKTLDLSGRRVIVFATHGLVPGDLNGLTQPALALSSPVVAGVGGDGILTMEEILGLRLDADWVVLSACNTASGKGAGAEAVSGLGRAFFYAGARALLASNWPVETTSARLLTSDLFRRQAQDAGLTRAEALRQAMSRLIDGKGYIDKATGKTVFSYAHPIFWAPFTLVGDGAGGVALEN